jgi:hypothetical protein
MRRALILMLLLLAPAALGEEYIPMPNLVGKTLAQARAQLKAAGFVRELEISSGPEECPGDDDDGDDDARPPVGKINCQTPNPGASVNRHAIVQLHVYEAPTHEGQIVREQIATLVGLTVERAKQELKRMGHDGEVIIEPLLNFSKSCGVDKVCAVDPLIGAGVHDPIRLKVNPKAKIALPPG